MGPCSTKSIEVDTQGIHSIKLARGSEDHTGPDLGLLVLSPLIASSLVAKKSFVDLDQLQATILVEPPPINEGVWVVQGFLQERTQVKRDELGLLIYFYNFTGLGTAVPTLDTGEHDYYSFPIDFGEDVPSRFNGMSGGGLWQVRLRKDDQSITHRTPLFSGVLFFQEPLEGNEFVIRCHGRQSSYVVAGNYLRNLQP